MFVILTGFIQSVGEWYINIIYKIMSMSLVDWFLLNASLIFFIGIFGIITRKNIIKILLSINILQTGVNILLIGIGYVEGGNAPIITENISSNALFVDPLPQALVLTSIVIGFGTTALGLMVTMRYFRTHKTLDFRSPQPIEDDGSMDKASIEDYDENIINDKPEKMQANYTLAENEEGN